MKHNSLLDHEKCLEGTFGKSDMKNIKYGTGVQYLLNRIQ